MMAGYLKKLRERHKEIKRLLFIGYRPCDVAQLMNMSPGTISAIKNCDIMQEALEEMQEKRDIRAVELGAEMRRMVPLALQVYEKILTDPGVAPSEAGRMARDVVDRVNGKPAQTVRADIVMSYDEEEVAELRELARAAGILASEAGEEAEDVETDPLGVAEQGGAAGAGGPGGGAAGAREAGPGQAE